MPFVIRLWRNDMAKTISDTIKVKVTVPFTFTRMQICDLLSCAIEGGSNYWCVIKEFNKPDDVNLFHSYENAEVFEYLDYPLSEGGSIVIGDCEGDMPDAILNLDSIKKGLEIMGEKYPRHMNDFIMGHFDADTGDVFLQCCVYGEIVFG
jgi:hypothetical protein